MEDREDIDKQIVSSGHRSEESQPVGRRGVKGWFSLFHD